MSNVSQRKPPVDLRAIADDLCSTISRSGFRASVYTKGRNPRVYVQHSSIRTQIEYGYIEVTASGLVANTTAKGGDGRLLSRVITEFERDSLTERAIASMRDEGGYGPFEVSDAPVKAVDVEIGTLVRRVHLLGGAVDYRACVAGEGGERKWVDVASRSERRGGESIVRITLPSGTDVRIGDAGEVAPETMAVKRVPSRRPVAVDAITTDHALRAYHAIPSILRGPDIGELDIAAGASSVSTAIERLRRIAGVLEQALQAAAHDQRAEGAAVQDLEQVADAVAAHDASAAAAETPGQPDGLDDPVYGMHGIEESVRGDLARVRVGHHRDGAYVAHAAYTLRVCGRGLNGQFDARRAADLLASHVRMAVLRGLPVVLSEIASEINTSEASHVVDVADETAR